MNLILTTLDKLFRLKGFRIYKDENENIFYEADGIKYNASCLSIEEGIIEAYLYLRVNSELQQKYNQIKLDRII